MHRVNSLIGLVLVFFVFLIVQSAAEVPSSWTCDASQYDDRKICHCECGAHDPDCDIPNILSNCPAAHHCGSNDTCILSICGDGEVDIQKGEECDAGDYCDIDCSCKHGYTFTTPRSSSCIPYCGDNVVVDGEICDGNPGCLENCTCDPRFRAENKKCVGCGNGEVEAGEQCDSGSSCNSECKCESGFEPEAGTNGCVKKSSLMLVVIISVALAVVLIAVVCVIVFVVVPFCYKRRRHSSSPGDVELKETNNGFSFDSPDGNSGSGNVAKGGDGPRPSGMCVLTAGSPKVTAAPFVGQRNYMKDTWSVVPDEADFNTNGLEVEVGAQQQQMFELRNMSSQAMQFSVNVPKSNKFFVAIFPDKGTVQPGYSLSFRAQITLYCNVQLDQVPFAISVQFEGDEKNQQYVLVPMKIRARPSDRIDYDDLVFDETVGEGSFGAVWRGKYQNQVVAIKTLRTITENALKDFLREIEMLTQFRNPYIMGYFGSVITNDKLCMVIEYLSFGSLSTILKQYHLSPRLKTRLALDSVKGLAYLHSMNVMHRDIKPGNVLVASLDPGSKEVICKVADFGTSRILNGSAEDQAALQKGLGTPLYMAPEILGSNKTYIQSADVYSFGIMLAHIWNEKAPYSDLHFDTPWALANYVSSGNRPQIEEGCPQAYFQLMTQCWQADPAQRPSFDQCVDFLEQLNGLFAEQGDEPGTTHYSEKLE